MPEPSGSYTVDSEGIGGYARAVRRVPYLLSIAPFVQVIRREVHPSQGAHSWRSATVPVNEVPRKSGLDGYIARQSRDYSYTSPAYCRGHDCDATLASRRVGIRRARMFRVQSIRSTRNLPNL